jgi:hypothetical protein
MYQTALYAEKNQRNLDISTFYRSLFKKIIVDFNRGKFIQISDSKVAYSVLNEEIVKRSEIDP